MENPELDLAWNFIEKTDRNIFLTGKAGTGKTTFLHKIKTESNKRLVVVAPTGVAAINAKGVTIHSFFQMPFGPIIPGETRQNTSFKHKFSKAKIDIIKSIDLLIIDEISMVRADLLDGIDQVLKRYRDRNKVFGGVQVLMIGDLQQLAPIIKPHEWSLLKNHYENAYFFSSHSFKQSEAIKIELKHIYRQDDEKFIEILNEIRTNNLSDTSIKTLNQRYQPNFKPNKNDGYITLTTHNNRAKAINDAELNQLTEKCFFYKATITGKFSEYAYPTQELLELKLGAQVMFIKNDSSFEKEYYNGKIGKIVQIDRDSIYVQCPEDSFEIEVKKETWENVSYTIDDETKKIIEKKAGSFTQIPLRLAWAITIHKSQGLTFEKAIIDAEASFAHGQTYVALSRCKSLEGIVLKTPISTTSIINDKKVSNFTESIEKEQPDTKILADSQKKYQLNCIAELFNYYSFLFPIKRIIDIYYKNKSSLKGNVIEPINILKDEGITAILKISNTFKEQIIQISENINEIENDPTIQERILKGITYFLNHTDSKIKTSLDSINFTTDNKQVKKDLTKQLDALEELTQTKITILKGLQNGFSIKKYLEIRAKAIIQTKEKPKKKRKEIVITKHPVLFETLRQLRTVLANETDVPHFQVFKQSTLFELCEYLPTSKKELVKINGFGKIRVQKYGAEILEVIAEYRNENNIKSEFKINFEIEKKQKKVKKESTKNISLILFKQGNSIAEIAKERNLAITTIQGHLTHFIPTGEIKVTDLMPKKKYLELKKIMQNIKYKGFKELKDKISDKFTYAELKYVHTELNLESV